MWINQICGVFIFNRHGKSFLILGSDDSNSNALRIGQTTALIFIGTLICCMIIYLYSTIYCFDSLALALSTLASLASLSCFQHRVVLTTCRLGEGAYLLITYSFFLYVCIKLSVRCIPLSRICGVFFGICLCMCSICGWCEAAACVFELKTVFKKIFHWLNQFSCLYISVLQPTTSDDHPNFEGDFFSKKISPFVSTSLKILLSI